MSNKYAVAVKTNFELRAFKYVMLEMDPEGNYVEVEDDDLNAEWLTDPSWAQLSAEEWALQGEILLQAASSMTTH